MKSSSDVKSDVLPMSVPLHMAIRIVVECISQIAALQDSPSHSQLSYLQ